jgi:hypothetical protein
MAYNARGWAPKNYSAGLTIPSAVQPASRKIGTVPRTLDPHIMKPYIEFSLSALIQAVATHGATISSNARQEFSNGMRPTTGTSTTEVASK